MAGRIIITPSEIAVSDFVKQERLIGKFPHKLLLSSLLGSRPTKEEAKTLNQETSLQVATESNKRLLPRQPDYQLTRQSYIQHYEQNPHGRVHIFDYKNVKFTLAGSQWNQVPNKNIYKLLLYTRPDVILLQIRPDQLLNSFDLGMNGFSSRKYFNQIRRVPEEVMPSAKLQENLAKEFDIQMPINDKYVPYELYERIDVEKIATCCLYSMKHNNVPIVLCDLPEIVYRESIANPHTLVQLQQYFSVSAGALAKNPDIYPSTPLGIAQMLFPEVFLKQSDEYITTLLEYIAAKKEYKRVFALLGNGQSDAVTQLLDNRSVSHLEDELSVPKIKGSMLKDLTCEDMVERHAILDVMSYGLQIFNNFSDKKIRQIISTRFYFFSTLQVIEKYCDPNVVDYNRFDQMRYLHLELLKKYQIEGLGLFKDGQKELKKEYMRRAELI